MTIWRGLCLSLILLLTGCVAQTEPNKLVWPGNELADVSCEQVAALDKDMTYAQIFAALGPTQDVGGEQPMAVYRVDDEFLLSIPFLDINDVCPLSGGEWLETVVSAVDIVGKVTRLSSGTGSIILMVEAGTVEHDEYDAASVRADENTVVKSNDGIAAALSDIAEGDTVSVVFNGPVAESYPVQAYASCIRILQKTQ